MAAAEDLKNGGARRSKSSGAVELSANFVQVFVERVVAEENLAGQNFTSICQPRIVVGTIPRRRYVSATPLNSAE